ncbi:MAG: roadblock/LC7 domain-containing protein [Candidatus Eisenbacteria bacterium]
MAGENWALFEEDFWTLNDVLYALIASSYSRSAMLVDSDGRLIANVGEALSFDSDAFASLTAADVAASRELASMLGERDFRSRAHQGTDHGVYQSAIDNRVILVVLYDKRTTLGLVRLKADKASRQLSQVFSRIFDKLSSAEGKLETVGVGADFAAHADQQIDKLFGGSAGI